MDVLKYLDNFNRFKMDGTNKNLWIQGYAGYGHRCEIMMLHVNDSFTNWNTHVYGKQLDNKQEISFQLDFANKFNSLLFL